MNNSKKSLKASNGITLIALVITIIVLLILAGISISMLSGDNSILQKVTDAKTNTDNSQIQERINLAYHSSLVDGQGKVTEPSLESELKKEFNKDSLDEGWLDKTSVEGKWKITIDGISSNVPAGETETSEYGIQPDGTFKTKPGMNPTDGQTYNDYNSKLIETEYDQQILENKADIGETVYYFFEFPLVYYYHESGDFLGVFSVD